MPDYSYDSAAEWNTGDFTNANAVEVSGKLTPGVSPETLATNVSENDLSVYLRCREGSGASIENVGSAGDGTLAGGSWAERADGRHYITGGLVTVAYHASMKVAETDDNDDETTSYNWTAQIRVQFGSVAAAVFMQRANRFQLGMDASGLPYVKNYYHISRVYGEGHSFTDLPQGDPFYLNYTNLVSGSVTLTLAGGDTYPQSYSVDYANGTITFTSGGTSTGECLVNYIHHEATGWNELADDTALEVDTWYTIGASCSGGALTLYVDGVAVATLSSNYADNDSEEDLVAGFAGDWDQVMYSGNESASNRVSFPNSGSWEKRITLAGDRAARYLEMNVALADEHSISISLAFADSDDDLDYVDGWSYASFVDGVNEIYPPPTGLYHGTHLLIKISCSEGAYDREAVLVDYLKVYLREPATPVAEQTTSPYADLDIEDVSAEDLSALIREVQNNRTVIKEISRTVTNLKRAVSTNDNYGEGGLPGVGDPGGATPSDPTTGFTVRLATTEERLDICEFNGTWHLGMIRTLQSDLNRAFDWIARDGNALYPLLGRVAALENAGYATTTEVATAVSDHNASASAHDNGAGTSLYDHKILSSGVHGASEGDPLMTLADTNTAIGNHAALGTNIHGIGSGNYVAWTDQSDQRQVGVRWLVLANASLENDGVIDVAIDSLIGNHASVSTGIHGAPAGKPVAYASEGTGDVVLTAAGLILAGLGEDGLIDDAIDALIGDHASNASAHHAKYTTGEAEAVIAAELVDGQSIDLRIDALIATHEGSSTAHGSVESNFASHKDATTGIHGASGNYLAKSTQSYNTVETIISNGNFATETYVSTALSSYSTTSYIDEADVALGGFIATNESDISDLDSRVTTLENA